MIEYIYYLARDKKVIGTTDKDLIAFLYATYMRFLPLESAPGYYDGAGKQGERIRVGVCWGTPPVDKTGMVMSNGQIYDICKDGTVVDPKQINVDMETGMPKEKK